MRRSFLAQACGAILLCCASLHAADIGHGHHEKSEGVRAGVTSLDVCAEGDRIHLLTVRRDADLHVRFEYQQSTDAGETFSQPVVVTNDQPLPEIARRGQDAQLAACGDNLVALWTTRGTENRFGRGPLATAISADGGRTWSTGPNPADDASAGDHAFADIFSDDSGMFHAVWLDARGGEKGLIYARSTDGGKSWSKNQTLVGETCECCWNTLATAPGGRVFVLYRAKHPRDMAIIRSNDAGDTWSAPEPVGRFNWQIDACPHVGGGLAITGSGAQERLLATVWTGAADVFGTYFLDRKSSGWTAPRRMGGNDSTHTDVAASEEAIVATWDAYTENGTAIFATVSTDAATTWQPTVRLSVEGANATHPRVVATARGLRIFWTQQTGAANPTWTSRAISVRPKPQK